MGKLSFLLSEDYIKPKIYFKSTKDTKNKSLFTNEELKKFNGINNLTELFTSNKGFIINAFQIDYYQKLPELIAQKLRMYQSSKKIYILGPELSLSIIKRSATTAYQKQFQSYEYINSEYTPDVVTNQCMTLLEQGHILYILPEALTSWKPTQLSDLTKTFTPLCSTLLSQNSEVPIVASILSEHTNQVVLSKPYMPIRDSQNFNTMIEKQSLDIYNFIKEHQIEE